MELEVKLNLLNSTSHAHLKTILTPFHAKSLHQHNFFFDGARGELSSKRAVLRLRIDNGGNRCVVSLKGKAVLVDGVSRVEEDEEEVDAVAGKGCVEDPARLRELDCRVLRRVLGEFGGGNGELGFVGLGGFENLREVYVWNGLKLEVDETKYAFGTCYEVECESEDPDKAKCVLEDFLKENGVQYEYSKASKFAVFRSGKLPLHPC